MWTVGVIGTGSFGQKRVQALLDLAESVEDVFIFDQDISSLQKTLTAHQSSRLHSTRSAEELLAHPKVDVICICTPNFTHAEYCLQALAHHKHVLCEKPITRDVKTAKKLIRKAKKNNLIIKAGTNHRYFPSVQEALRLYQSGQLGELHSFHGSIGTNGERIQNTWFWKKELSAGGTLLDNGHHLLDLARLFCGKFSSCLGHSSTRRWKASEVEDYAVAIFETDQKANIPGCEAVLRSSWRQPHGYMEIELWGSKGAVQVSVGSSEVLKAMIDGKQSEQDFSTHPKTSLHQELKQFLLECADVQTYISDTADHLLSLTEMIDGFYTSQKAARRISL
ncbi:Gfo/Idh/MocA family oxidoreductase [Patescibacteria group bacterium]|nr:Gfo/Idh/MocA family oxidoreductase [Patescibacteria group bacterium]